MQIKALFMSLFSVGFFMANSQSITKIGELGGFEGDSYQRSRSKSYYRYKGRCDFLPARCEAFPRRD